MIESCMAILLKAYYIFLKLQGFISLSFTKTYPLISFPHNKISSHVTLISGTFNNCKNNCRLPFPSLFLFFYMTKVVWSRWRLLPGERGEVFCINSRILSWRKMKSVIHTFATKLRIIEKPKREMCGRSLQKDFYSSIFQVKTTRLPSGDIWRCGGRPYTTYPQSY